MPIGKGPMNSGPREKKRLDLFNARLEKEEVRQKSIETAKRKKAADKIALDNKKAAAAQKAEQEVVEADQAEKDKAAADAKKKVKKDDK